jgi:hypothetical protein
MEARQRRMPLQPDILSARPEEGQQKVGTEVLSCLPPTLGRGSAHEVEGACSAAESVLRHGSTQK